MPHVQTFLSQEGEYFPSLFSLIDSFITFLYPRWNLWWIPPRFSINSFSPADVIESVTIIPPECSFNNISLSNAIRLFLLISRPFLSIKALLSPSASNIIPKSALLSRTAFFIDSIASFSSGFGMWFGKLPSGFKNWLPAVSPPRTSITFSAKNPAAPFPASIAIRKFFKGLFPFPILFFISSHIYEA